MEGDQPITIIDIEGWVMIDCYRCYHFRDSSGVYEGRSYCKRHADTSTDECKYFLAEDDDIRIALYELKRAQEYFERETINMIEKYNKEMKHLIQKLEGELR